MGFREFFLLCSKDERKHLALKANTSVGYLIQIAYGRKCSPWKAYEIEVGTAALALDNPNLKTVSGATMVRDPKTYRAFVAKVRAAA